MAVKASNGFQSYNGKVGRVTRVFWVQEREKIVLTYPSEISPHHGGTFTPHPFETFTDMTKEA